MCGTENRHQVGIHRRRHEVSREEREQRDPQFWGAFEPRIGEIENIVNEHTSYGISANQDMETGEFDYIAGFEVSSAENLPPGMVHFEVPGEKYAVFATTLSRVGETFDYAYQTWLPKSNYQPTGDPDLEVYGEAFHPQDPDSEFDVYVAIR